MPALAGGRLGSGPEPRDQRSAGAGAAAFTLVDGLLPYALGFAAGAMIFVVVEELIPESQQGGHADLATSSALVGFTLMMVLDVAFG